MTSSNLRDSVLLARFRQTAKDIEQTGFRGHLFLFGFGVLMFASLIAMVVLEIGSSHDMVQQVKVVFMVYTIVEIVLIVLHTIEMAIMLKRGIINPRKDIIRILYTVDEGVGNVRPSCLFVLLNLLTYTICFKFITTCFPSIVDLSGIYGCGFALITAALVFDLACVSVLMILRYQALHYDPVRKLNSE